MARILGLPLLSQIPMLQAIREGGDAGQPAALLDGPPATIFMNTAREIALGLDAIQTKPPPLIVFED